MRSPCQHRGRPGHPLFKRGPLPPLSESLPSTPPPSLAICTRVCRHRRLEARGWRQLEAPAERLLAELLLILRLAFLIPN